MTQNSKLDAWLNHQLTLHPTQQFDVFIYTKDGLDNEQLEMLNNLQVRGVKPKRRIFTATVDCNAIAALTQLPWVEFVKASQPMTR